VPLTGANFALMDKHYRKLARASARSP